MIVRAIESKDIKDIVRIHLCAFNGFFLTSLGKQFLEVYYSTFRKNEDGVVIGCYNDENELIGFGAASLSARGFNTRLVKSNLRSYVILGFKLLVCNPASLLRLLRNFTKQQSMIDSGYAELYSIGVRGDVQGKGVGSIILEEIERICSQKKDLISLTTDYYNNKEVINFYHKCGYKILCDFITYPNRRMYRLIKQLK